MTNKPDIRYGEYDDRGVPLRARRGVGAKS